MKSTVVNRDNPWITRSKDPQSLSRSPADASAVGTPLTEPQPLFMLPALEIPLDDQALTFYSRYYVEVPHGLPEVMDGHLKYAVANHCYSQPRSILSLTIFALSHALFGRARKSLTALNVACTKYSKALVQINLALKDASAATSDEVLHAVMLLSFYENSVMDKTSHDVSSRSIQSIFSRCSAHRDGAMAMLNMRRQLKQRTNSGLELDKLVRRSLVRSLVLRSIPPPAWLRDGSQYGERGSALELDRCMVEAAELRHQASKLPVGFATLSVLDGYDEMVRLYRLLAEAQTLDHVLATWANDMPIESRYITRTIPDDQPVDISYMLFDAKLHIYPTAGHAGMWNYYRAVRLIVNDVVLKTLAVIAGSPDSDIESLEALEEAAKSTVQRLADDLCASMPDIFGLIETHHAGPDFTVVTKIPPSLDRSAKAITTSFLCWPLTIAAMVWGIPEQHQRYMRDCLLYVGEIVNDGALERIAACFSSLSHDSANFP